MKHTNLKCVLDNLFHPYILSTTVLSDSGSNRTPEHWAGPTSHVNGEHLPLINSAISRGVFPDARGQQNAQVDKCDSCKFSGGIEHA